METLIHSFLHIYFWVYLISWILQVIIRLFVIRSFSKSGHILEPFKINVIGIIGLTLWIVSFGY